MNETQKEACRLRDRQMETTVHIDEKTHRVTVTGPAKPLVECVHGVLGGERAGCQQCIDLLADEQEEAEYEDRGEAAFGREDN